MMYQGVNERTNERTEMFWTPEELDEHLDSVSSPDDFWDVLCDGRLVYYYQKMC